MDTKGVNSLKHQILTFEELIAPLSRGKVMVVVECLNIEGCEQPEIRGELAELLNLSFGTGYDDWEEFLDYGFVLIEGENKQEFVTEATLLIDYLRNDKFQAMIQADLFVDGFLTASSWTGEPEVWNIGSTAPKPAKSVVLRFPVERINRNKDKDSKK